MRWFKTPYLLKRLYPSLIWQVPGSDAIFLTFDDGPHPEATPWVLSQLANYNAKATFFCVGENIERYPHTAKAILNEGHTLANHTHHHTKGWDVSNAYYHQEVLQCEESIHAIKPGKNHLFRPPYGRISRSQIKMLANYRIIMWSHLSWDFDRCLDPDKPLRRLKKAKGGSILVFHDSDKAFGNLKKILPELLLHFHLKGYEFKSLT